MPNNVVTSGSCLLNDIFIVPFTKYLLKFKRITKHSPDFYTSIKLLSAILLIMGVQLGIVALIGDLLAVNRRLLEDVQYRLRKLDTDKKNKK